MIAPCGLEPAVERPRAALHGAEAETCVCAERRRAAVEGASRSSRCASAAPQIHLLTRQLVIRSCDRVPMVMFFSLFHRGRS